ncbi:MAG: hypothetical protein ACMUIM_07360 [bacterium]
MTQWINFISFLPTALFFTLWIAFPVWLALRRSQGLIRLERTNQEGETKQIGMYLELGIFLFAIPFTTFFFLVVINLLLSPFVPDPGIRVHKSLDASFMLIAICLFLYIYLAERKIYLRELKRRDGVDINEE